MWIWRNPASGWQFNLLGGHASSYAVVKRYGPKDNDKETNWYTAVSPEGYWSFRGYWWGKRVGLRYTFGWKISRKGVAIKEYTVSVAFRFK